MPFLIPRAEQEYLRTNLAKLGYATLWDYEHSPRWQARKDAYYRTHEYKCVDCGVRRGLQLHHLSYVHLGYERDSELVYVCDTDHEKRHARWTALALRERKKLPQRRSFLSWLIFG